MDNIQLPEYFFEENPLIKFSKAMITHLLMITITESELNEEVTENSIPTMEKSRYEQYLTEKEYITNLHKPEDIISYMRKIKEPTNRSVLIQKAIEYQDDIMPLLFKKIRTSGHDVFIENTAILLANVDTKYIEQLYSIFPEIRNAYARSELCIVFGVAKKEKYIPFLLEQFKNFQKERPDMEYEQGPLLALYLMHEDE